MTRKLPALRPFITPEWAVKDVGNTLLLHENLLRGVLRVNQQIGDRSETEAMAPFDAEIARIRAEADGKIAEQERQKEAIRQQLEADGPNKILTEWINTWNEYTGLIEKLSQRYAHTRPDLRKEDAKAAEMRAKIQRLSETEQTIERRFYAWVRAHSQTRSSDGQQYVLAYGDASITITEDPPKASAEATSP